MVNWLKVQFERLLNARKRARYAKTLSKTFKFTERDIEVALLLYDHLGLKFLVDVNGSLYFGKLDSDGHYAGRCIGYCGHGGGYFYSDLVSEVYSANPSLIDNPSLIEFFGGVSKRLGVYGLDIPKFKSVAELKMKLELKGKV